MTTLTLDDLADALEETGALVDTEWRRVFRTVPRGAFAQRVWQYTGDGLGGQPHTAPGIGGVCERDYFIGTEDQLKESWKWNLNHQNLATLPPPATGFFPPPSPTAVQLPAEAHDTESKPAV